MGTVHGQTTKTTCSPTKNWVHRTNSSTKMGIPLPIASLYIPCHYRLHHHVQVPANQRLRVEVHWLESSRLRRAVWVSPPNKVCSRIRPEASAFEPLPLAAPAFDSTLFQACAGALPVFQRVTTRTCLLKLITIDMNDDKINSLVTA